MRRTSMKTGKLYYPGLLFLMLFFMTACLKVTGITPAKASENVSRNAEIIVLFNIAPDPLTINRDTFVVKDDSGNVVDGEIECDGKKIKFKPASPLIYATRYDLAIKTVVRNKTGLSLGTDFKSSFTTEAPAGLNVIATSPADNEMNVKRDTAVKIYFDSKLDSSSISSGSVYIKSRIGKTVKVKSVSVRGNCLTMEHDEKFDMNTVYSVNISKGIKHINGWTASEDYSFEFKTHDGLWRPIDFPFVNADIDSSNIRFVSNPDGYALAVWSQIDGFDGNKCPKYNIYASLWNKVSWENPQPIGIPGALCDGPSIFDVQASFSMDGRQATVLWAQSSDTGQGLPAFNIYSNCWNGTAWQGVKTVGTAGQRSIEASRYPGQLSLSYGPDGRAFATWLYWEFAEKNILSQIMYSVNDGDTWSDPEEVFPTCSDTVMEQQVGFDKNGHGMLIMKKLMGTASGIYASHYNGAVWGDAKSLGATGNSINMTFLSNGDVLAAWFGGYQYETSVIAYRWDSKTDRWESSGAIGNAYVEPFMKPAIAVGPTGDAVMAWKDGENRRSIFASRYNQNSWGLPQLLASPLEGIASNPEAAGCPNGDIFLIWWQRHIILNRYDLCVRKLDSDLGIWGDMQIIKSVESSDAPESLHVAVSPDSSAVLIWKQGGSLYSMIFD
jgi:hypothetical protein